VAVPEKSPAILTIEEIVAGYIPGVPILDGVQLTLEDGEMVTIVGPNGAGKSTLIRAVIGLLKPWSGRVLLRGDDVTGRRPHSIVARGVGYVAQRDNVFATMAVEENLELGALTLREGRGKDRIAAMYELFPRLQARRRQPAGTLSGGERQMLALARALMANPSVLLLDEPSAGLSPLAIDLIFEKIEEINNSGVAVLMVEQNARRALAMSHRGYVLDAGRNRFEGRGPDLLNNPEVVDLYLGGSRPTAPYLSA
jgi:ABC-type branched-subunit amino acid transport system ATPase component